MRPTTEATRNPIRPIPHEVLERIRFTYRTESSLLEEKTPKNILRTLVFQSTVTVAAFLVLRSIGLIESTGVGFFIIHGLLALWVFFRLRHAFGEHSWKSFLTAFFGAALVFVLVEMVSEAAANIAAAMMVYATALVLLAVFADAVASHYVAYLLADPRVTTEERQHGESLWSERFRPKAQASASDIAHYRYGWAILLGLFLLALLFYSVIPATPLRGTFVVLLSLVSLVGATIICSTVGRPSPALAWRHTLQALSNWYTYNETNLEAPGLFRSPGGRSGTRRRLGHLTISLLTAALVALSSYFPLMMVFTGPALWQQTYLRASAPREPRSDAAPFVLRPYQRRILESLPPEARAKKEEVFRNRHRMRPRAARRFSDVTNAPEKWLYVALLGFADGHGIFIAAILSSFLLCVLFPPLFFLAASMLLCGRQLAYFHKERGYQRPPDSAERWNYYVERLIAASRYPPHDSPPEADHLWLGKNAESDYPVLLHRPLLREHAWILGDTGSGKTHLAVTPLATQLIRYQDSSVVVIDLKGDPALFHGARIEAEKAGLPFKWFTNDRNDATYAFNPFLQSHFKELTVNQRVQILLQALGLEYGEFYGKGYFSAVNEAVLRGLLRTYPDIRSFRDVLDYVMNPSKKKATTRRKQSNKEIEDSLGLTSVIERLAELPTLNLKGDEAVPEAVRENAIDMGELFDAPQVIYFYLPSLLEPVTVRGIAKLGLYSLLTAGFLKHTRARGRTAPRNVYVFIDEFQQIVAHNLEIILRQARSMGIGVILANQNLMDLKTPDADLIPTVEGNTTLRQVFSASSLEQRMNLERRSGQTIHEMVQTKYVYDLAAPWSLEGGIPVKTTGYTESEHLGPRFGPNDIIQMGANQLESIVEVSRDSGLTRFSGFSFRMRSDFHITEDEFERRKALPWPENKSTVAAVDLQEDEELAPDDEEVSLFDEQADALLDQQESRRSDKDAS